MRREKRVMRERIKDNRFLKNIINAINQSMALIQN